MIRLIYNTVVTMLLITTGPKLRQYFTIINPVMVMEPYNRQDQRMAIVCTVTLVLVLCALFLLDKKTAIKII